MSTTMSEPQPIDGAPDTVPPTAEPTNAEVLKALLAMRDTLVDEFAKAFLALNGRIDCIEGELRLVKHLVEQVTTDHLHLRRRVELVEKQLEGGAGIVGALHDIAEAVRTR